MIVSQTLESSSSWLHLSENLLFSPSSWEDEILDYYFCHYLNDIIPLSSNI